MQITLEQTCYACPEQYDATDETGRQVGYLRLRHGKFTVECPDVGGTLVYAALPDGDGTFTVAERDGFLQDAIVAIRDFHCGTKTNKYVVAYISFHDNVLTQEIVEGSSEVEVAKSVLDISEVDEYSTIEQVQAYAFDSDSMISVFKI